MGPSIIIISGHPSDHLLFLENALTDARESSGVGYIKNVFVYATSYFELSIHTNITWPDRKIGKIEHHNI